MTQQPQHAVEAIQQALENTIGSQLMALYLYGSAALEKYVPGLSDLNLLAVVAEGTGIHQLRTALRPIWQNHAETIRCLPLIATPPTLARHLQLNPLLAGHLLQYGRLLAGRNLEITSQPITPTERLGRLALAALAASEALAPQLHSANDDNTAAQQLLRLANYLEINEQPQANSPINTFAAIQAHLAKLLTQQPSLRWQDTIPTGAPPIINSLLAIYEVQDRAIFLLPDWPPQKIQSYIRDIDWTAVAETLQGQYNGLQITTPSLIRLIYRAYRSADHYFQNYQHAWGQTPLASFDIPPWQVYRDLARLPSRMELKTFPNAYITAEDDQLDKLIHDFQNRLLNIQLREELMIRLDHRQRVVPPNPLPGRETPPQARIAAIFDHFNWWANHYTTLMRHQNN